jgi:hypothetical protein
MVTLAASTIAGQTRPRIFRTPGLRPKARPQKAQFRSLTHRTIISQKPDAADQFAIVRRIVIIRPSRRWIINPAGASRAECNFSPESASR